MEKNIYIIRHCKAEGQYPDAALTEAGQEQTKQLAEFLENLKVDRIISSPYARAQETIRPFAERAGMEVEIDNRLAERHLEPDLVPDWLGWMKESFVNMELRDAGGESGAEATKRITDVIDEVNAGDAENTMIVTHGGMITLLLHEHDEHIGFEQWRHLSNPDVYLLKIADGHESYERIWEKQ